MNNPYSGEYFAQRSLNSYNILGELSRTVRDLREQFANNFTKNQANNYEHWLPEYFVNIVNIV